MNRRKKLMILVDWFAPGFRGGGPIQSCINICNALKDRYEIYVLTTDTDHGETKPYEGIACNEWIFNDIMGVQIYYANKRTLSTAQLARQISFVEADFIYLNHLFSPYFVVYPLWLKYRNQIKGKVVVCPRGALYDSALSIKSYKKRPFMYLFKWMGIHQQITFHATNDREQKAIAQYFPGSEILVADNLPDFNQQAFSGCIKETGKLSCIFISRIMPIKNLLFLLERLQRIKEEVKLSIVGPVEEEVYWQDCQKVISQLPPNITVRYLGPKPPDELPALIQQHHLFILPTKGENFGHSIFEALLNGRPVLISDQTPWLNLQEHNAGWVLSLADSGAVEVVIKQLADFNQEQFDHYAKGAWQYANNYIHHTVAREQYYNLFK